jgi:hypothetical protein
MWLVCLLAQSLAERITPLAASRSRSNFSLDRCTYPNVNSLFTTQDSLRYPGANQIIVASLLAQSRNSLLARCLLQTDQPCLELFTAWLSFSSSPPSTLSTLSARPEQGHHGYQYGRCWQSARAVEVIACYGTRVHTYPGWMD